MPIVVHLSVASRYPQNAADEPSLSRTSPEYDRKP
jgi:hypothetical protein